MLAQRTNDYNPPIPCLATLRHKLAGQLSICPCPATQQRVLLAVNEVIANILRHAAPQATDIQIDFIDHEDQLYCVVIDDGGAFGTFREYWHRAAAACCEKDMFAHERVGLKIVSRLWPKAFYIPRCEAFGYNSFFLPLTAEASGDFPPYFQPAPQAEWRQIIRPLLKERRP